jgi:C-terminal processing protease CtpA/Prc
MPLTPAINRAVAQGVIDAVKKYYFSLEGGLAVERQMAQRLNAGAYDRITSAFDLLDAVDADLEAATGDAHLRLSYSHEPGIVTGDVPRETREDVEADRADARTRNFGLEKAERLPGNVGLLDVRAFVRPEFSGSTVGAAMTFVSGTEALIVDLRNSSGGSPDAVLFLASYFFHGAEPVHLGDFVVRVENRAQQFWTLPYVPGSRYLDRDVFVLVSRRTFSAPEGFTWFLQRHKKAVVVGEPTRGGTHSGVGIRVHPNFAVVVPTDYPVYPDGEPSYPVGRPVYPSTWADTKGTGISPDIPVTADRALKTAHLEALTRRVTRNPSLKESLAGLMDTLRKELVTMGAKAP